MTEPDAVPNVVAYRVGQLEQAVQAGFKEHNDKLDKLINNFITKEEFENRVAPLEIAKSKNWIFNTLSAVAGAILLFLVQYALTHK